MRQLLFNIQARNVFINALIVEDFFISVGMAESSQLMPLINTGNYRGGTNDKPGPTN